MSDETKTANGETNAANGETIVPETETITPISETEPVAMPPVTVAPELGAASDRPPTPVAPSTPEDEVNWFLRLLPANNTVEVPDELIPMVGALGYLTASGGTNYGGVWIGDQQTIELENLKALRGQLAKRGIVRIHKSAAWREGLGAGFSLVRIVGNSIYLRKD